jgi:hypothetical protein
MPDGSIRVDDPSAFALDSAISTALADPPWRFTKPYREMAPQHRRVSRHHTMSIDEIASLPVSEITAPVSHLYLSYPNSLLTLGLASHGPLALLLRATLFGRSFGRMAAPMVAVSATMITQL